MPFEFECPGCGLKGYAKDSFANKKAKCKCGQILDFTGVLPDPTRDVEKTEDLRSGLDRRVRPASRRRGERRRPRDRREDD
ncbi:MAG: hypothetical protein ACYTAF_16010 [Planctomycetota bacterium]|jgi:hypothetical protein